MLQTSDLVNGLNSLYLLMLKIAAGFLPLSSAHCVNCAVQISAVLLSLYNVSVKNFGLQFFLKYKISGMNF